MRYLDAPWSIGFVNVISLPLGASRRINIHDISHLWGISQMSKG
jgi:hypothetical protein